MLLNTRPYTSAAISAAIESIIFEVAPHPPYSPDLVLSDFWLFRVFKTHPKAIISHMMQKFQDALAKWFQKQPEKYYTDRFEKLVQSWQRCIE
jgi:hypothetical protein